MKTKPSTHPPRFSNRYPFRDLTTPAAIDFEERVEAVRARYGEDAHIEINDIQHAAACASHNGRACSCSPIITVIIQGEWLRIAADGSTTPAPPPTPLPSWEDEPDGHIRLRECLPLGQWMRCLISEHAVVIIGQGTGARYLHGSPIDEELTRRLRRCEAELKPSNPFAAS